MGVFWCETVGVTSRLVVLGSCGAWPEPGRACSGLVLKHGGTRVVLDLGYGTLPRRRVPAPRAELFAGSRRLIVVGSYSTSGTTVTDVARLIAAGLGQRTAVSSCILLEGDT